LNITGQQCICHGQRQMSFAATRLTKAYKPIVFAVGTEITNIMSCRLQHLFNYRWSALGVKIIQGFGFKRRCNSAIFEHALSFAIFLTSAGISRIFVIVKNNSVVLALPALILSLGIQTLFGRMRPFFLYQQLEVAYNFLQGFHRLVGLLVHHLDHLSKF